MRRPTRAAKAFGVADLVAALVTLFGVFVALPARWWPVDVGAVVVALTLGAAGGGLLRAAPWGERAAKVASVLVLTIGLLLVGLLAVTASYLAGIYGPVGMGGAVLLVLVAALALPYLVVLPVAQLWWLGASPAAGRAP